MVPSLQDYNSRARARGSRFHNSSMVDSGPARFELMKRRCFWGAAAAHKAAIYRLQFQDDELRVYINVSGANINFSVTIRERTRAI